MSKVNEILGGIYSHGAIDSTSEFEFGEDKSIALAKKELCEELLKELANEHERINDNHIFAHGVYSVVKDFFGQGVENE